MKNYCLEVCVDSVESAIAAKRGGADRLELCGNLIIGGTTPSLALFQEIRRQTDIRIHVLIRPRFGDFCYSPYEFAVIKEEVREFCAAGAEGVVIGCLQPDGSLHMEQMKELITIAGDASITLHRAFDVSKNPMRTLAQAKELGIHTILTSGQENNCQKGKVLLRELVKESQGEIEILIGAGVSAEAIEELYPDTKAHSYHMSGKKVLDSAMTYRNPNVSMGLPEFSEYQIWQTDEEAIRKAKEVLERLSDVF